jgi:hypothetical protein
MVLDVHQRFAHPGIFVPVLHLPHSFCLREMWLAYKNGVWNVEYIHGKQTVNMDAHTFATRLLGFSEVLVDIGAGDGRFVHHMAQSCPTRFVIGIDAYRENLCRVSRRPLPNAMYLIANAEALPEELSRTATSITVNFPWGSLLVGLLTRGSKVLDGLHRIAQHGTVLEVRLNSSALLQVGRSLEEGGVAIQQALQAEGFDVKPSLQLDAKALRNYPTTWAKRLAHGLGASNEDVVRALCLRAVCSRMAPVEVGV